MDAGIYISSSEPFRVTPMPGSADKFHIATGQLGVIVTRAELHELVEAATTALVEWPS